MLPAGERDREPDRVFPRVFLPDRYGTCPGVLQGEYSAFISEVPDYPPGAIPIPIGFYILFTNHCIILTGESLSMSDQNSPLARLVLFMVCLAIAGSALAVAHYAALDLPAQNSVQNPPANSESCTIIYSGNCAKIRATICHVGGTDNDWLRSCMEMNGCCV